MKVRLFSVITGVLILNLVLWYTIAPSQFWIERYYSQGLYPKISHIISPLVTRVPFSLSFLVLLGLVVLGLIFSVYSWQRKRWLSWLKTSALLALLGANTFVLVWGANYSRQPIARTMDLAQDMDTLPAGEQKQYERAVALRFAYDLLEVLQQNVPTAPLDYAAEQQAIASASLALQQLLQPFHRALATIPTGVKRLPKGTLVRWESLGVASPWLLEPHVDDALPAPYLIAVAAHELAHSAGYAQETDADMLGMLAALRAEDSNARYAGALYALSKLLPSLADEVQQNIVAQLPAITQQQRQAYAHMFTEYPQAAFLLRLQARAYDSYLRSQGVEDGVAAYGRSIRLLVLAYQQGYVFP